MVIQYSERNKMGKILERPVDPLQKFINKKKGM